jgi:hypothetical protein
MPTDLLVLGGFVFDEWSTPETIPFGGKQALKIHKLPGGERVFDLLGPDEDAIKWSGRFWREDAPAMVAALNGMRISGAPVSLSFAGNSYSVVVEDFKPRVIRYPQHYEYSISCEVVKNSSLGSLSASPTTFSSLVSADMASALSVLGL